MKMISGSEFSRLPASYIRGESDRAKLSEVVELEDNSNSTSIPVIDLSCEDRTLVIDQIAHACRHYGFFQVINHGVSKEAVKKILDISHEFFNLPVDEKMKLYSNDPCKTTRLSSSFNLNNESVNNWRDYLRLHCYPLDNYMPDWPTLPSSFKEIVSSYCSQLRALGFRLQEAISESLGLARERVFEQDIRTRGARAAHGHKLLSGLPPAGAHLRFAATHRSQRHHYSSSGSPGIRPSNSPPRQVVAHQPAPGDLIQALSNDKYKSVWHRAVVNAHTARVSIASFMAASDGARIRAPREVTGIVEENIVYRFHIRRVL